MARQKPKADEGKEDIHIYLPPDLMKTIRAAAAKNYRPLSSQVEMLLRQALETA